MKQRQLGAHGPKVSAIGFGAMGFAGFFGSTDEETSMACLDAVVAAGINFWDTANVYGMGVSENIIGKYLAAKPTEIVLATKAGIVRGERRTFNNDADYLRAELEESLKRLGRDKVELFYIHRRQPEIAVETVVETLAGFIEEGLIDGYGLSEISPGTLRRAAKVHHCTAVQNEYSLWSRGPELGLLQACDELGTAFIPFSPLARGFLSDASIAPEQMAAEDFRREIPRFTRPNFDHNAEYLAAFREWCQGKGWTVAGASIAWVLDQGEHLIPIPGTRSAEHLAHWAEADQIALSDADRADIARILPVGFAHGDRYNDWQLIGAERYS
ncbi:aldo/keto reductase [Actibacterium mucosum KCTC 23349]|uniref:Aldo/keto reductase n=1 Tax=Actibacterium mucosum KCTC 23349 TaxID=1454373 RepID=A0A037ZFW9_9RHOB|nr:aldo/keto reductase [Actibacterium mucosum]KAJ55038.1 aldo/keto reductase [Actibacterium mucosum KCTC 23349]